MKNYASLSERLSAHLGDIIFANIISGSVFILILLIGKLFGQDLRYVVNYSTLLIISWCAYSSIMNSYHFRGTFGKQYLGLKVVNINHQKISIPQAFFRFVLGFLLFGVIVGIVSIYFTTRKQGLHDLMLGTVVTKQ